MRSPAPLKHRRFHRLLRAQARGQAMVEYSVINWLLVVALIGMSAVRIDWGGGTQGNFIDLMFRSLRTYYDSFYYLLNLPFP